MENINSAKGKETTLWVITPDRYLFQKIRLELFGILKVSESEGDICLVDIDAVNAPLGAYTMSRHGACDVSIPFEIGRIRAFIEEITAKGALLSIDRERRCAYLYGREIRLTELEAALLYALIRGAGEFIERRALISEVFGEAADTGMLNLYVHYLREKLESGGEKIIISSRKAGYKIDGRFLNSGKEDKR